MKPRLGIAALAIVLSVSSLVAQAADLLTPPDGAPRYRLSNFRLEDDQFGKPNLLFDYTRLSEGEGRVQLAGRSAEGDLRISFAPNVDRPRGEVRLEKTFGMSSSGYDYEFYFVVPAYWAGQNYGDCLVSNTVRMGNPGSTPRARAWNEKERAAYEKQQLADITPDALPPRHDAVDASTTLVPGMPIKASRYAEWVDAEVLALVPINEVTIRYADKNRATTLQREDWLAVDPDVLSKAASAPDTFRPSMRVLPGGTHPLPRDAVAIDPDMELPRGTPLLLHRADWETVYVSEDKGIEVEVRYEGSIGGHGWDHDRTDLAIRQKTREALSDPAAVKAFADNLPDEGEEGDGFKRDGEIFERLAKDAEGDWGDGGDDEYLITDRSYPIETRIPRGAQKIPTDLELPPDTPVAYCWARSWEAATLIEDRGRFVIVKEDDNVSDFVWRLKRDQVIIQDKTLRKLRRTTKTDVADLQKTLRTWSDSSGEHKVEARFVRIEDGKVTLKTDAGREIKLPLARLCEDDQALLKNIKPKSENPFE